jgi:hypothetical protein
MMDPTVPAKVAEIRSPAASVRVATVVLSDPVTRVLAVAEKVITPVKSVVPEPGAVVPVSFLRSTVGTVELLEQMMLAAFTRYARLAMKML